MKNIYKVLTGFLALLAMSLFMSCEGPEGPAGEAGDDGIDGNEVCKECHNDALRDSVSTQYAASGHAAGANVGYAGGRNDCAACHSHEGFIETQHTGMDTTAADIPIPTPVSCNTCHSSHSTLDFENDGEDYALRTESMVALLMDGSTIDFEGASNLCANCHQPRSSAPEGDGTFAITSPHYGPHHGPQATILEGIGGYEIAGSVDYPAVGSSTHRTGASCTTCHMTEAADDNTTGGHSMTPNMSSCTSCHTDATDFDVNDVQTDVADLVGQLKDKLVAASIINEDGHLLDDDGNELNYGASLNIDVDQAGAYFNYATIVDDRSMGVHNPDYTIALLQNSIEIFN